MRGALSLWVIASCVGFPVVALAQGPSSDAPAPESADSNTLPADAHIDIAPQPPEAKVTEAPSDSGPEGPAEAPPPPPHHKGLVLESSLGALGFTGQFRHVAPPAFWLHAQLGYELTNWLMAFGEGELAFTDTSESQQSSQTMAFNLYGFGGGARATLHASARFAAFVQGDVGGISANVPHNSLAILGFKSAESLGFSFGARVGAVWYQVDRHLALTAQAGIRDAVGFAKSFGASDLPLMWDGALGLSYTF